MSAGRVVSHGKRGGLGHPALLLTRQRVARVACALEDDLAGVDSAVRPRH